MGAVESGHPVTYGMKHALHLMVAAFVDGEAAAVFGEDFEIGGLGGEIFVGEVDSLFEVIPGGLADRFGRFDVIDFTDALMLVVCGVGEQA